MDALLGGMVLDCFNDVVGVPKPFVGLEQTAERNGHQTIFFDTSILKQIGAKIDIPPPSGSMTLAAFTPTTRRSLVTERISDLAIARHTSASAAAAAARVTR